MKPSILIIADFPNWAYHEIQKFIVQNLKDEFEIYSDFLIFNTYKKTKHPFKRLKLIWDKNKYQHIKNSNIYDIVVYLGFYFEEQMVINWQSKKIVKGIYTDGFPPQNANFVGNINEFKNKFLNNTDAVVCGSYLIHEFYKTNQLKSYYANCCINESLFKRGSKKQKNTKPNFIVGWTGNPKRTFKGLESHIIPAVKLAQKKYPDIELKTRFSGPMETLPMFYENVDMVVIASDADAGPSMFGEASLMEVPSVSTDIGWPHEVIQNGVNGFIVKKDVHQIATKIIELYENRELLYTMSKQIRNDYLEVLGKDKMIEKWRYMFNDLLNNN